MQKNIKVALVTGSTSGIGLGIAEEFAIQGYNIMLNGFGDRAAIKIEQDRLKKYGKEVHYSDADLSQPAGAKALIEDCLKAYNRLDILVNNAGIQHVSDIENFPSEMWQKILNLNLSAAFYTIQAALPIMKQHQWGRIINIASAHGLVGSPFKSAYVASKHGLVGLTKTVALEVAGMGITANAICPGWVLTPLVQKQIDQKALEKGLSPDQAKSALLKEKQPSGEFVTVHQIGQLAAFLSSEAASQMTGGAISIDGGWTAC